MSEKGPRRYRISVPLDDVLVLEFIAAQNNLSISLRQIIKDHMMRVGCVQDVFASDVSMLVDNPNVGLTSFKTPPKELAVDVEDTPPAETVLKSEPVGAKQQEVVSDKDDEARRAELLSERHAYMQGVANK